MLRYRFAVKPINKHVILRAMTLFTRTFDTETRQLQDAECLVETEIIISHNVNVILTWY